MKIPFFNREKPTQLAANKQPLYQEKAVTIFDWMLNMPDPDEVLRRAGRSRKDLKELERDDEVMQAIETRLDALLATPWRLEPGAGRNHKRMLAAIAPHMHTIVTSAWQAVPYGYSVLEAVWEQREGAIVPAKIAEKPFWWFRPQQDGSLRYFPEDGSGGANGIECDPRKFFITQRRATYINPYGEALLSRLYFPVKWRIDGWRYWLEFLSTYGTPIVIGKTVNYEAFVTAMQAQGVRSVIGWQSLGDKDEIQTINASSPGEFERVENALIQRIQRLILGQTLTSNIGDKGSYAAAKVHNEVRDDKRRSDIRLVTRTVQQILDQIAAINGWQPVKFVMEDNTGLEKDRAERDEKLAPVLEKSGFRLTQNYFLDRYDLDEDDIEATQATTGGANMAAKLSAGQTFTPAQQEIEQLADDALAQSPQPVAPEVIHAAIQKAETPQELAELLAELAGPSEQVAELVERALFAADVMGYTNAEKGRV